MDDLISRQAAIDKINERQRKLIYCFGLENDMVKIMDIARSIIIAMPSADVQPVRHGRWETVEGWDGDEYYRCSECGAEFVLIDGTPQDNDYLCCPHCGALMDEVT